MKPFTLFLFIVAGLLSGLSLKGALSAPIDANWPQFRGPASRGVAHSTKLPDQWSATENVAWKTDIAGNGWSSPIVWEKSVFLTTAVSADEPEAPRKGLYFGGERREAPRPEHRWKVLSLDLSSGKVNWEKVVHHGRPAGPKHLKNSYASETPVTDGERIYVYLGNEGVFCLDLKGEPVWSTLLEPHKMRAAWGTAASPVLHRDRLYVVNDNDEHSYLLALDKKTGKEMWRIDRDEKSNWSTPYVWETRQRTEIVTPGTGKVRAYDLDGKLLWWFKGMSSITIATPYADEGLLYVSSGFVMDGSRPLYAIKPEANGDISLEPGQTNNASIAWCQRTGAPYNPSTLLYENTVYVLHDAGLLSAYDSTTGATFYNRERLPEGRHFTASPWACNGRVFCLNEDGVTFVVRAGKAFELLRTNKLAEDDMCLATPAVAGDRLLIRSAARIYCIVRK